MDKNLLGLLAVGGIAWYALKNKSAPASTAGVPGKDGNGPTFYTSVRPMCLCTDPVACAGGYTDNLPVPGVHIPGNNFGQTVMVSPNFLPRPQVGRFWPAAGDMNPITGRYSGSAPGYGH